MSGALCIDGVPVVATSLERITRKKNDILLPITRQDLADFGWKSDPKIYQDALDLPFDLSLDADSIDFGELEGFQKLLHYLLDSAGIALGNVDCVVYGYRYVNQVRRYFKKINPAIEFIVPEHHFGHACQAFLSSPFEEAAVMVVDGQGVPLERTGGDQLSGCLAYGTGSSIKILADLPVRHSLGGIYAAFTKKIGFKTNEEGKTMGLAPYGGPKLYDELREGCRYGKREWNLRKLSSLMGTGFRGEETIYSLPNYSAFLKKFRTRKKGEPITDLDRDLAFAVQKLTEDVMVHLADWLYEKTGSKNLCIAGGVGLNCVANYQVLIRSKFERIFIHPNAGDNGLAIGQALYAYSEEGKRPRRYVATHDYMGREYSSSEISSAVSPLRDRADIRVTEFPILEGMYDAMAERIANGQITSWCQGRSEFGPRALGNRSILADPRRTDMKDILNSRVKFRESFRPFTPSVISSRSRDFFELEVESPFMLLAAYVKPGMSELVPAITHVDNTARVQTVTAEANPRYFGLISAFERRTGIPMVLDTSFNIADEPIVETPADAVRCFLSTDIDVLGIDRFLLEKVKHGT
jgi:carbamoyltransferase